MNFQNLFDKYLSIIDPLAVLILSLKVVLPLLIILIAWIVFWEIHKVIIAPALAKIYHQNAAKLTHIQKQILLPLVSTSGFLIFVIVSQIGSLAERTQKFNLALDVIIMFVVLNLVNIVQKLQGPAANFNSLANRLVLARELAFLGFGILVFTLAALNRQLESVEVLAMLVYFGSYLILCNFWSEFTDFLVSKGLVKSPGATFSFENTNNTQIINELEEDISNQIQKSPTNALINNLQQQLPTFLAFICALLVEVILASVIFFGLIYWSKATNLSGILISGILVIITFKRLKFDYRLTSNLHLLAFLWLIVLNLGALVGIIQNLTFPINVALANRNSLFVLLAAVVVVAFWIYKPNNLQLKNKYLAGIIVTVFLTIQLLMLVLKFS